MYKLLLEIDKSETDEICISTLGNDVYHNQGSWANFLHRDFQKIYNSNKILYASLLLWSY